MDHPCDARCGDTPKKGTADGGLAEVSEEPGRHDAAAVSQRAAADESTARPAGSLRVAVYAIARNEAKFARRFMDSVREADCVVVADTGSQDATARILREEGAIVHPVTVDPWRFDVARNLSLDLVPEDVDLCVKLDLDEVMTPQWREAVERHYRPGASRMSYWNVYSWKAPGVPDLVFIANTIHARHGYVWKHACHEAPYWTGRSPETCTHVPRVLIEHYPDGSKPRSQYLPLLELAFDEEPSARTAYYLGREYVFSGRWDDAIRTLQVYLDMAGPDDAPQRAAAMRHIARSYGHNGDTEASLIWSLRACAEGAGEREGWVELARAAYHLRNWALGYAAARQSLGIGKRASHCHTSGEAWGELPYDLGSICAWNLGFKAEAAGLLEQALRINPADQRLRRNATFMGVDVPIGDRDLRDPTA